MAQINQITKIRLTDGQEVAIVDWSHRDVYSSVDLLSGFTDAEVYGFTYVNSDPVSASANITTPRVATLQDCNNSRAGEMDALEEALVYGLAIEVYAMDGAAAGISDQTPAQGPLPTQGALAHMHWRLIAELEVSQKAFLQAPMGWWVAGIGPVSMNGAPNSATVTRALNGMPGHDARHNVQIPVHIGGTEKFKVIIYNPGGSAVTFDDDAGAEDSTHEYAVLRINMDCLYKRPTG